MSGRGTELLRALEPFRVEEARKAWLRGWALLPLHGLVPGLHAWERARRPTLDEVLAWAREGNLGLRTGPVSGVVVVDVDFLAGPARRGWLPPSLPRGEVDPAPVTRTVSVNGRPRFLYFRAPDPCPETAVAEPFPWTCVHGVRGMVPFPGSVHPETGSPYLWALERSPEDVDLADLPASWLRKIRSRSPHARTGGGGA